MQTPTIFEERVDDMTIAVETYLVVALAFAVFSAVTALGSSLVLGAGFERLRAGFEIIKSQTGFFSDALHNMDKRMDTVEKQGGYFFQAIHNLEQQQTADTDPARSGDLEMPEASLISTSKEAPAQEDRLMGQFLTGGAEIRFH